MQKVLEAKETLPCKHLGKVTQLVTDPPRVAQPFGMIHPFASPPYTDLTFKLIIQLLNAFNFLMYIIGYIF